MQNYKIASKGVEQNFLGGGKPLWERVTPLTISKLQAG